MKINFEMVKETYDKEKKVRVQEWQLQIDDETHNFSFEYDTDDWHFRSNYFSFENIINLIKSKGCEVLLVTEYDYFYSHGFWRKKTITWEILKGEIIVLPLPEQWHLPQWFCARTSSKTIQKIFVFLPEKPAEFLIKYMYEDETNEMYEEYHVYCWNGKKVESKIVAKCSFCEKLYDWEDIVHSCSIPFSKKNICKNCSEQLCDCLKVDEDHLHFLYHQRYTDNEYYFLEFLFYSEDQSFLGVEVKVIDTAEVHFHQKEFHYFKVRYSDFEHFLNNILKEFYNFQKDEYIRNKILKIINELKEKLKVKEKTPTE